MVSRRKSFCFLSAQGFQRLVWPNRSSLSRNSVSCCGTHKQGRCMPTPYCTDGSRLNNSNVAYICKLAPAVCGPLPSPFDLIYMMHDDALYLICLLYVLSYINWSICFLSVFYRLNLLLVNAASCCALWIFFNLIYYCKVLSVTTYVLKLFCVLLYCMCFKCLVLIFILLFYYFIH